jgi:outer membrane protein assembly factor BamB
VRALGADDGLELWRSRQGSAFSPFSVPAVAGEDVIVADRGGAVARFDGRTGERRWDFRFPQEFAFGSPLVIGDGVTIGTGEGRLAMLRLSDGRQVADAPARDGPLAGLAVDGSTGTLVAGVLGPRGGLAAYVHDPRGRLISVESPTILHPGPALLNFVVGSVVVVALLTLAFRVLGRSRGEASGDDEPGDRSGFR